MLHKRGEFALEFVNSLDKEYELSFSDNLFLICYYSFNLPLQIRDIMRMAKTFEFTNNNYLKKYPDLFADMLKNIIVKKYGSDHLDINSFITKPELRKIKTQQVTIFANTSIMDNKYPVPLISENFKLKKEMNMILEAAHEAVKLKLAEMKKAGIEVPVVKQPVKNNKSLIFEAATEGNLIKELSNNQKNPLRRHFCYIQLQDFYYKYRDLDKKYLDKCIEYCYLDINSLEEMKKDYIEQEVNTIHQLAQYNEKGNEQKEIERVKREGFTGRIPAFSRLSIIYEKQGNYKKAIEICDSAISNRESIESFNERKAKLENKLK